MALSGIDRDEMMELLLGTVLRIRHQADGREPSPVAEIPNTANGPRGDARA
jgi:hypothetical protein